MDWNTLLSYGAELALTDAQMASLKNVYDKTKDSLLPACLAVWHKQGEMGLLKQALPDEKEQNQFLLLLHISTLPFAKEYYKAYPDAMFQEIKAPLKLLRLFFELIKVFGTFFGRNLCDLLLQLLDLPGIVIDN